MITCLICGKKYKCLNRHLKTHNITAEKYKELFLDAIIVDSESEIEKKRARKISRTMTDKYKNDTEYIKHRKELHQDPEYRSKLSRSQRKAIKEKPDIVERRTKGLKKVYKEHPEKWENCKTAFDRNCEDIVWYEWWYTKWWYSIHTKEYSRKMSNANKGKERTPEWRENLSISGKKSYEKNPELRKMRKKSAKKTMVNPEMKAKICRNLRITKKPTSIEKRMMEISEQFSLQDRIIYTGDGRYMVGCYCPDFVDQKKKLAIEVDGAYWHQDKKADEKRDRFFQDNGWTIIHFSEDDLNFPKKVIEKIKYYLTIAVDRNSDDQQPSLQRKLKKGSETTDILPKDKNINGNEICTKAEQIDKQSEDIVRTELKDSEVKDKELSR